MMASAAHTEVIPLIRHSSDLATRRSMLLSLARELSEASPGESTIPRARAHTHWSEVRARQRHRNCLWSCVLINSIDSKLLFLS